MTDDKSRFEPPKTPSEVFGEYQRLLVERDAAQSRVRDLESAHATICDAHAASSRERDAALAREAALVAALEAHIADWRKAAAKREAMYLEIENREHDHGYGRGLTGAADALEHTLAAHRKGAPEDKCPDCGSRADRHLCPGRGSVLSSEPPGPSAKKDRSTPEGSRLWSAAEDAAKRVATWPAWKRGHAEPRPRAPSAEGERVTETCAGCERVITTWAGFEGKTLCIMCLHDRCCKERNARHAAEEQLARLDAPAVRDAAYVERVQALCDATRACTRSEPGAEPWDALCDAVEALEAEHPEAGAKGEVTVSEQDAAMQADFEATLAAVKAGATKGGE